MEGRSLQPSSPSSTPTTTTSGEQKSRYDDKASPKAFVCPECGKQFNAHYNLTRHMPVHTGARPFVCKVRHHLMGCLLKPKSFETGKYSEGADLFQS